LAPRRRNRPPRRPSTATPRLHRPG
jgi:hypothetical protein